MMIFGDFHFIRPWWLLMVPLGIVIWRLHGRALDPMRAWKKVIDAELLEAQTVGHDTEGTWRTRILLAGWIIAAIAIAGPTWKPEPSPFSDDPVPVMMLLNVGESMNVADIQPSRLERAHLKIADFAKARDGLPLGLVAYAGSSHLVLPPTRDTGIVADMALEISPEIMPRPGSDLAGALDLAAGKLAETGGVIVVVLDTVVQDQTAELEAYRKKTQIPVEILAIAGEGSTELDSIKKAASALGAEVTLMSADNRDIDTLIRRSANMPVAVAMQGEGARWQEAGWWLVPVLLILMLTQFRREESSSGKEVAP